MFCAKTECEIYRNKRYCKTAAEKQNNGVCKCRHAKYRCEVGELCFSVKNCSTASGEAKLMYYAAREHILRNL